MLIKSIADYFAYMTPEGASIYALIFLGVVIVSLSLSGNGTIFPEYLVVFSLFLFTIWYIYVKLIVPDPLQL